jgi:hypothetical protein
VNAYENSTDMDSLMSEILLPLAVRCENVQVAESLSEEITLRETSHRCVIKDECKLVNGLELQVRDDVYETLAIALWSSGLMKIQESVEESLLHNASDHCEQKALATTIEEGRHLELPEDARSEQLIEGTANLIDSPSVKEVIQWTDTHIKNVSNTQIIDQIDVESKEDILDTLTIGLWASGKMKTESSTNEYLIQHGSEHCELDMMKTLIDEPIVSFWKKVQNP